tara:strand:- start:1334 stop:1525 length:192 start_codon:yes stop_codon:yes gene_type:complete
MKKFFAILLCGAMLTTFGIGCGGNPTESGDGMPSPSNDPSATGGDTGADAKPADDKGEEKKGG